MGIDGKTIEKLYIKHNGFKIIDKPILYDLIEYSGITENISLYYNSTIHASSVKRKIMINNT